MALGWIKKAVKKAKKFVKEKIIDPIKDFIEDTVDAIIQTATAILTDIVTAFVNYAVGIWKYAIGDKKGGAEAFAKANKAAKGIAGTIVGGAVGVILTVAVNTISLVQRIFGVEKDSRGLSNAEIALLQIIFEDSVDYAEVKITEGNLGLLGLSGRPFTTGYNIRNPTGSGSDPFSGDVRTLVHEMVHIWQFENGGLEYVPYSLVSQWTGEIGNILRNDGTVGPAGTKGYAFDVAVAAGYSWEEFNPEQQATFIDTAFQIGVDFTDLAVTPMLFDGTDYTNELENALPLIRAGEGTPQLI